MAVNINVSGMQDIIISFMPSCKWSRFQSYSAIYINYLNVQIPGLKFNIIVVILWSPHVSLSIHKPKVIFTATQWFRVKKIQSLPILF